MTKVNRHPETGNALTAKQIDFMIAAQQRIIMEAQQTISDLREGRKVYDEPVHVESPAKIKARHIINQKFYKTE